MATRHYLRHNYDLGKIVDAMNISNEEKICGRAEATCISSNNLEYVFKEFYLKPIEEARQVIKNSYSKENDYLKEEILHFKEDVATIISSENYIYAISFVRISDGWRIKKRTNIKELL